MSISEKLERFDEILVENNALRDALKEAQYQIQCLLESDAILRNRVCELEDEIVSCKNELRHTKRQLNDKTQQALAAAEREVLLIQLLERSDQAKSSLQLRLETECKNILKNSEESEKEVEDVNTEAISKLEDMLESLLLLGEQEQHSENARLMQENAALQNILALLQNAEMKKWYLEYIAANIHTCNPEMPVIALPHDSSSPASTIFLPRFPDSARDFDTAGKNHDEIPFDRATTAIDQGGNISPRAGFQEVAAEMNLDEGTAQQMTDNQTKLKNLESLASSTSKTAPLTCNDLQIRPDVANKRNKWPTPRWNHKRHTPDNHDSS